MYLDEGSRPVTSPSDGRVAALGAAMEIHPPTEEAGHRLVELTRRVLGCRGAIISLVDEDGHRPFVAAAAGLPESLGDWWGRTPLSLSLADPAGATRTALQIADIRKHRLLEGDEAVRALDIASYLGVPLLHGDGTLGSLVAVHDEPREWSEKDVENLRDLAALVVTEVELRGFSRREEDTRRESAARAEAETRQGFSELVHGLDAIVNERDPERSGAFTFVSRRAEELLGYPAEQWLDDRGFWESTLLHPEDRERATEALGRALRDGTDIDHEYRVVRSDGETVWLRDLVTVLSDSDGRPRLARGVMIDVTRQKRAQREAERSAQALGLLQEVASEANEADQLEGPLAFAVRRMCEYAGWPVGHAYLVSAPDPVDVLPTSIWHMPDVERFAPFRKVTEQTRFRPGEGLPGRVLTDGAPCWMGSLEDADGFPRIRAARACGLQGGFAFPVLAGPEVAAVLEFFFEEPAEPNAALLELSSHVGTILGRVVERARAQAERRASESRLRRTVETANEAFISIDAEGCVREWNGEAARTFGWSREEVLGRRLSDLVIPPEYRDRHEQGLRRFQETGEGAVINERIELPALTRSGDRVPVELTISPMREGTEWVFNAFLHDISDRKAEEAERERRSRQLHEAQKLAGIGSWEWDPDSGELAWTDELYRIFGMDPSGPPITYEAYRDRIHPEDTRELEKAIQEAIRSATPYSLEHRVIRSDDEVRVVQARGQAVVDREGEVVRLIGTAQDLTDRKALEEKGRQLVREQAARSEAEVARERIRQILESITDAFFAVDAEGRITHVNTAGATLLGHERDDLPGKTLTEVAPELEGTVLEEVLRRCSDAGEPLEVEDRLVPAGRWFEIRAYPTGDGLSVYLHDIHDRKRVERELRASEERYRFLADAIPQQIWTATPSGALSYVNRVVTDYFGREAEELLEEGWDDFVHPEDREAFREDWHRSLESGDPFEGEHRIRHHEGEYRWHLFRAVPQREDDSINRWFGSTTDVHGRKRAEEERDQALDDLERINYVLESDRGHLERQAEELRRTARALRRSNEELDQFAYVASHDLKAPLRGIANLVTWLVDDLKENVTDETQEYVDLLQGRVQRMENLIDGILQYSRAGRAGVQPEEIAVRELMEEVVDMVSPPEEVTIDIDHLPVVHSPRSPLQQVFLNLVTNAVKHADTEEPRIEVRVSDEGSELVEFSVSDNGPGIDPAYHERIFTIFQTLKPRDEEEGTGIGLAVVKKLVERYGGQVWVESEEGEGATFRFLWPRNYSEKE